MAKYLVTAKIEVETISGPSPLEYQIQAGIDKLLFSEHITCSVDLPENRFASSISRLISVKTKVERLCSK